MTPPPAHLNQEEKLQRLTRELTVVKRSLREMSATVGRIERQVKRSADMPRKSSPTSPKKRATQTATRAKPKPKAKPAITPAQALSVFDNLAEVYEKESPQKAGEQLRDISIPDLKVIAGEMGIPEASRLSKNTLVQGIAHRLNERAMLRTNINAAPPRKDRLASVKSA